MMKRTIQRRSMVQVMMRMWTREYCLQKNGTHNKLCQYMDLTTSISMDILSIIATPWYWEVMGSLNTSQRPEMMTLVYIKRQWRKGPWKWQIGSRMSQSCISSSFSLHFPSTSVSVLLCLTSIIPHQFTHVLQGYDDSIHHFWLSIHFLYPREHWWHVGLASSLIPITP
jgi:hypothetical protein